jgi:hypothetical protein
MLADFERFLDDYLERMEERLLKNWEHAQQTPGYYALHKHMEWLVRCQCLKQSLSAIARADHHTRQTVSGPVHELAELLGLELAKHQGGRPLGAEDRQPRYRRSLATSDYLVSLMGSAKRGRRR